MQKTTPTWFKKSALNRFARFQLSSATATATDFGITIILKEVFQFHYLPSTSIGTITGGIVNFILNRHWVFRLSMLSVSRQAIRYFIIWTCSILLNISCVYILTDVAGFNYVVSKIIAAVSVGVAFNFNMQRKFVFPGNISASKL